MFNLGQIKKLKTNQAGFSLIELTIYIAILVILMVITVDLSISATEVSLEAKGRNILEEDGRFILQRLTYDIRRSSQIVTPTNLGDSSQRLELRINNQTYTYQLNSANLDLTFVNSTNNLNSPETLVKNLSFQKVGNSGGLSTVKINFTLESKVGTKTRKEEKSYTTAVSLR
ncbi:MAG: hypothetical protein A2Y57_02215 [Candidatus Woykebacteria bacterium RBG_13_40_7b]|uniref:Prepilin-type N-terminal cleavage/methylation domain-containing protein n=1 Tax=Candidatus Woykebacteria bacterium RBG_13_40_7b TaxID=1802594 RepID=A0A1G1W8M7_9BACT|nr:MAG: hypothetical protein A2Y57_02215 [Candidatus Woykebacteria bacterium RBG_13_40_7b]